MMKLLSFFSINFVVLLAFPIWAQAPDPTATQFQSQVIENLHEKIYVHIDRPDHLTGEILWFKIYCVDAMIHHTMDVSKIAYVEILDVDNRPLLQTKVSLENGLGSGSFYIPATIATGNYLFRAYTNWMKNAGEDFFFQKQLVIINTLKQAESFEGVREPGSLSVQFFPEGGQLVDGVKGRVAFQVLDESGKGTDCAGAIVNQSNDTIVKFKSLKFGIGSFFIVPKRSESYHAIIQNSNRLLSKRDVLTVAAKGYSLIVKDTLSNKIKVSVKGRGSNQVQLFIHTRHALKFVGSRIIESGSAEFILERNLLGDGISHFTVFDSDSNPICERLYFKRPENILDIQTQLDQKEYSIRRKVKLDIQANASLSGNLSVSVFRADSLALEQNVVENLFLSSDLRGEVESPTYYFSDHTLAKEAADNLMLTHGWRRFSWKDISGTSVLIPKHLPEVKGHLIQGSVVDSNGRPAMGKIAYLASPGKKVRVYVGRSDSLGRVRFQLKDFHESGKIIVQTNLETDSLLHVEIENPFSNKFAKWKPGKLALTNPIEKSLVERSISMQVQDIFYEDETYFRYRSIPLDTVPFYGKANEVYRLDDYTRFPVMEEVMREYVKGVWVRKKRSQYRFMMLDKPRNRMFENNPLILLDGVPVFDVNKILDMDPLKIRKLEVVTGKYFLGPLSLEGIVSYSTYNGDLGGFNLDNRSISLDYDGLQRQREFYTPNYSTPASRAARLPDQRQLIYWNPNVKLIAGNANTLEFFTSDVEGKYFVVIEGLTIDGRPGQSTLEFNVSK